MKTPTHLQIWMTFLEIVTLVVTLSYNILRINQIPNKCQPKFYFFIFMAISSLARGISLLLIMEQPSDVVLDFLYTAPILLWIASFIIFMGHLGSCYLLLLKQDAHSLNSMLLKMLPCLSTYFNIAVLVIFYFYFFTKKNFFQSILILQLTLYTLIIFGCLFFSNKLSIELEEEVWMIPFLNRLKKLVLLLSLVLTFRIVIFLWIYTKQLNPAQSLNILLLDILIGEIVPYSTAIFYKIMPIKNAKKNEIEMKSIKSIKSMQEPLLS